MLTNKDFQILNHLRDEVFDVFYYFDKRYAEEARDEIHGVRALDEQLHFVFGVVSSLNENLDSVIHYCLDVKDRFEKLSSRLEVCNLYVEGNFVDDQF